jgi:GNAT superfamily N-acetyltransferase
MDNAAEDAGSLAIRLGVQPADRERAAGLFDLAFGEKLAVLIPEKSLRHEILTEAICLDSAFAAYRGETLSGICGFHLHKQSFTGGLGAGLLLGKLGFWRGVRACAIGALLVRRPRPGELLMDGVAVSPEARSGGIGGRLLSALKAFAWGQGYRSVRLDVVDTNPRARALYERHGFVAVASRGTSGLTARMGFSGVTTMVCNAPGRDDAGPQGV